MSVKMMTTEQIHTNLATIANMWPGGVPTEQTDNVNALKAELKRRGVEQKAVAPAMPAMAFDVRAMNVEQLTAELQKLSKMIANDPGNEAFQEQFANVRYELRNKLKAEQPMPAPPKTGAFDPETGETDMQKAVRTNGHVAQNFGQGVPSDQQENDAAQMRFLQVQAARARDIEAQMQLVRKHNLAKVAAEVAAEILRGNTDPNGDDIDKACTIGLQVAQTIYARIEL